jgi:hypothetical protein
VADIGCPAQDVGKCGRRERSHSVGKGGIARRGSPHDELCVAVSGLAYDRDGIGEAGSRRRAQLPILAHGPASADRQRDPIKRGGRGLSLMCGAGQNRLRLAPGRPAGPQQEGLRENSHTRPSRSADDDRADPGKDLAPDDRRYTDLRQAEDRVNSDRPFCSTALAMSALICSSAKP